MGSYAKAEKAVQKNQSQALRLARAAQEAFGRSGMESGDILGKGMDQNSELVESRTHSVGWRFPGVEQFLYMIIWSFPAFFGTIDLFWMIVLFAASMSFWWLYSFLGMNFL